MFLDQTIEIENVIYKVLSLRNIYLNKNESMFCKEFIKYDNKDCI